MDGDCRDGHRRFKRVARRAEKEVGSEYEGGRKRVIIEEGYFPPKQLSRCKERRENSKSHVS